MPTIISQKPQQGEDSRELYHYVRELVHGVNSLLNMKAILMEGRVRGLGVLRLQGNKSVIQIKAGEAEGDFEAGGVVITTPTVTVTSSQNPSNQGVAVRWIASLSDVTATGTIQFRIDGVNFGGPVVLVNGVAISAFKSDLHTGNHIIVAIYSGDPLHNGNSGSMTQHVGGRTDIEVTASENPATPFRPMHWDARISPHNPGDPRPTGQMAVDIDDVFFDNKNLVDIGGGDSGITTIDKTWRQDQAGYHNIGFHYQGDQNYARNDFTYVQFVRHTRGLGLTVHPIPGVAGETMFFDLVFDVQGGHYPTGNVQGWLSTNGGPYTAWGTAFPLINGARTLQGPMSAGHFSIFFAFEGDSWYSPVNSNTVVFDVVAIPDGDVTLTPTPQMVVYEGGVRWLFQVHLNSGQSGPFKIGVFAQPWPNTPGFPQAYWYINNQPCPIGFNNFPTIVANFVNGFAQCDVAAVLDMPWTGLPNQIITQQGLTILRADGTVFDHLQGLPLSWIASDYFALYSRP